MGRLTPLVAGIGSIIGAVLIMLLLNRIGLKKNGDKKERFNKKQKILVTVLLWLVFFVLGGFIYFNIHYPAGETAMKYMAGSDEVSVRELDRGILFDGYGDDVCLIFYPGAKVDSAAYAPILYRLAAQGIDCISVRMPLYFAFMDRGAAERFITSTDYDEYYVGGHSLGGVIAAYYAIDNIDKLTGVVELGAYTDKPLKGDIRYLAITASEDHVMSRKSYEDSRGCWPDGYEEFEIEGGNHSFFGDYGHQRGDGEAVITADEQYDITADRIATFIYGE